MAHLCIARRGFEQRCVRSLLGVPLNADREPVGVARLGRLDHPVGGPGAHLQLRPRRGRAPGGGARAPSPHPRAGGASGSPARRRRCDRGMRRGPGDARARLPLPPGPGPGCRRGPRSGPGGRGRSRTGASGAPRRAARRRSRIDLAPDCAPRARAQRILLAPVGEPADVLAPRENDAVEPVEQLPERRSLPGVRRQQNGVRPRPGEHVGVGPRSEHDRLLPASVTDDLRVVVIPIPGAVLRASRFVVTRGPPRFGPTAGRNQPIVIPPSTGIEIPVSRRRRRRRRKAAAAATSRAFPRGPAGCNRRSCTPHRPAQASRWSAPSR